MKPQADTPGTRVAAALRVAGKALTPAELATLSGCTLPQVYRQMKALADRNEAHNVHPGKRGGAMYAWGSAAPQPARAPAAPPAPPPGGNTYTGAELKRAPVRPGALDFQAIRTRNGDSYTPHRPPISLAAPGTPPRGESDEA